MDIKECILELIQKNKSLPLGTDFETFEYMDNGFLDSLGVLQFIMALEEEFSIKFTDTEFESPSFRTLGGLLSILAVKCG